MRQTDILVPPNLIGNNWTPWYVGPVHWNGGGTHNITLSFSQQGLFLGTLGEYIGKDTETAQSVIYVEISYFDGQKNVDEIYPMSGDGDITAHIAGDSISQVSFRVKSSDVPVGVYVTSSDYGVYEVATSDINNSSSLYNGEPFHLNLPSGSEFDHVLSFENGNIFGNNQDGTSSILDIDLWSIKKSTFSGIDGSGNLLSTDIESVDQTSKISKYNTDGSSSTISYSGPSGTGEIILKDIENANGTSILTAYNSDGSSTTTTHTGSNGTGLLISKDQENATGTSALTIYNPDGSSIKKEYSGPNETGILLTSDIENSDGTSILTTYSPDGSSISFYFTGSNGTGSVVKQDIEYSDGSSQITTYNQDGNYEAINYNGSHGTGDAVKSAKTASISPTSDITVVLDGVEFSDGSTANGMINLHQVHYKDYYYLDKETLISTPGMFPQYIGETSVSVKNSDYVRQRTSYSNFNFNGAGGGIINETFLFTVSGNESASTIFFTIDGDFYSFDKGSGFFSLKTGKYNLTSTKDDGNQQVVGLYGNYVANYKIPIVHGSIIVASSVNIGTLSNSRLDVDSKAISSEENLSVITQSNPLITTQNIDDIPLSVVKSENQAIFQESDNFTKDILLPPSSIGREFSIQPTASDNQVIRNQSSFSEIFNVDNVTPSSDLIRGNIPNHTDISTLNSTNTPNNQSSISETGDSDAGTNVTQPSRSNTGVSLFVPGNLSILAAADAAATPINIPASTNANYVTSLLTATITSLPTNGLVTLANGANIATDQSLTIDQLNGLIFTPAADAAGLNSSLGYDVHDPAGNSASSSVALTVTAPTNPNSTASISASTALPAGSMLNARGLSSQYTVSTDQDGNIRFTDQMAHRDSPVLFSGTGSMIRFADGATGLTDPTGAIGDVARVYRAAFNRMPDLDGLRYWIAQHMSGNAPLSVIAAAFASSPEFSRTYGALDNAGFVSQLYQNVLGRSGESDGVNHWIQKLASGSMSRGDVLNAFAQSPENKAGTLVMAGDPSNAEAARLYKAAFNRVPEGSGLRFWADALDHDQTPRAIAEYFTQSSEFQTSYSGLSNSAYVGQVYAHVLGRAAESSGAAFWTDVLDHGGSRGMVLQGIADSTENRAGTASATHDGWVLIPT